MTLQRGELRVLHLFLFFCLFFGVLHVLHLQNPLGFKLNFAI